MLLLTTSSVQAQDCVWYGVPCATATAHQIQEWTRAAQTNTAAAFQDHQATQWEVARQTATAQGTDAGDVFPDFGLFGTYTGGATPTPNLQCPVGSFDTENLAPDWAVVCRACVQEEQGATATSYFPVGFDPDDEVATWVVPTIATVNLTPTVATPTVAASASPSATATFTPSPTSPIGTPSGGDYHQYINFDGLEQLSYVMGERMPSQGGSFPNALSYVSGLGVDGSTAVRAARVGSPYNGSFVGVVVTIPSGRTVKGWGYWAAVDAGGASAYLTSYRAGGSWTSFFNMSATALVNNGLTFRYYILSSPLTNVDRISFEVHRGSADTGLAWMDEINVLFEGTPPTVAPSNTPLPTVTRTPSPVPSQTWSMPTLDFWNPSRGLTANCTTPDYIDDEEQLVGAVIAPSGNEACLTIIPWTWIGFSFVNSIIGLVTGNDVTIPDLILPQVQLCLVGVTIQVSFFGWDIDMVFALGAPVVGYLFRWGMKR